MNFTCASVRAPFRRRSIHPLVNLFLTVPHTLAQSATAELVPVIPKVEPTIVQQFDTFDVDRSGAVSYTEFHDTFVGRIMVRFEL